MNLFMFASIIIFSLPIIFVFADSESENDFFNKGMESFRLGEYEQAISYFDRVLEIEPNNIDALYNKGNNLSQLEKFEEAIPYYVKVLNLDPKKQIAKLKLEHALLEITSYRIGYLDGVLEITIHDSQGGFIVYHRTTQIKSIKHDIVVDLVEKWPIVKVTNRNNQNFSVHQMEFVNVFGRDGIIGLHEIPFSDKVDFPLATTWHYQIPVQKGDVVSYVYSIFRPVS